MKLRMLVPLLLALPLMAESIGPAKDTSPRPVSSAPQLKPMFVPEHPDRVLSRASVGASDQYESIRRWNEEGRVPQMVGIQRLLPLPIQFDGDAAKWVIAKDGVLVRAVRLEVEGAWGLRVLLEFLSLPEGAEVGVFGSDLLGRAVEPAGAEDSRVWAPMVPGPFVIVQITVPEDRAGDVRVQISHVGEIFRFGQVPGAEPSLKNDSCLSDASCFSSSTYPAIEAHMGATARLVAPSGSSFIVCSGALLNDTDDTGFIPYFMTANHCVSTQSASSTEFFWDYFSDGCNGSPPNPQTLPRSFGATQVAKSSASDVTLLRLSAAPSGRWYLGWDSRPSAVSAGTGLHRISHPNGGSQKYSRTTVVTGTAECTDAGRPSYIYSSSQEGSVKAGSSGSLAALANGQVVGQLSGVCVPEGHDNCSAASQTLDGALSAAWSYIGQYLSPTTGCGQCVPTQTVACMLDGRFRVELHWRNQFASPTTEGIGRLIEYAENAKESHPQFGTLSENVFFSMFNHAPKRVELVVKMFKGVGINDYFWITAAGMTDNEYWVKVTDTVTCKTWERMNPHGKFNTLVDQWAFPLN